MFQRNSLPPSSEDEGSDFHQNIGSFLQNYTTPQPRRQPPSEAHIHTMKMEKICFSETFEVVYYATDVDIIQKNTV
jgi:hypothetical protein